MSKLLRHIRLLFTDFDSILEMFFVKYCKSGIFDWMSDKMYLKFAFRCLFHKKLDLNNPRTFNEKLNWLKLYDRKPEYHQMVDKYAAKKYVADIIGWEHIVPTFGVWDTVEEIEWDKLPEKFVLKTTGGSGGNDVVICKNKSCFDFGAAKDKLNKSLKKDAFLFGREWPYKGNKNRIIAEKLLEGTKGLKDYKFFCFNGEPKFLYVSQDLDNHEEGRISFVTMDWEFAAFHRNDYKPFEELPEKPKNFDVLKEYSAKLAKGHSFMRVDLYDVDDKIYFSELTFFSGSGYTELEPAIWDEKLGEMLELPLKP